MKLVTQQIPKNSKICIYGSGETGVIVKNFINIFRKDLEIICFLDSFNSGEINNTKIYSIKEFLLKDIEYDLILICSVFSKEIEHTLQEKNITNYKAIDYNTYCNLKDAAVLSLLKSEYINRSAPAIIEDGFKYKKANFKQGKHLLLNSIPKSGTGFLLELMTTLTGFYKTNLNDSLIMPEYPTNNFYYPELVDLYQKDLIIDAWHHSASDYNIEIIKKFNLKTVLLTRNIYDSMPSMRDYALKNIDKFNCRIHKEIDMESMDDEEQFDFLVKYSYAGMLQLYISWFRAKHEHGLDVMFITYDDLVDNTAGTMRKICDYYELDKTQDDIQAAIEKVNSYKKNDPKIHFNKGIKGRGSKLLTNDQRNKMLDYADNFRKDIDFSILGL